MTKVFVASAAAIGLLVTSSAHALTLTNRGAEQQTLQIEEGLDDPAIQDIVIAAGQSIERFCDGGCTITLENGEAVSFVGHEVVVLENGRLSVAE